MPLSSWNLNVPPVFLGRENDSLCIAPLSGVMDERAMQQVATRGCTVVAVSLSITLWLAVKTMVLQFMVFL